MKTLCLMTLAAKFPSRFVARFLFVTLVGFGLQACDEASQVEVLQLSGAAMGTSYNITIVAQAPPAILPEDITLALEVIENSMSTYRSDSELMQLNNAPLDTWIEVSEPLFEVLGVSQQISKLTNGAFDITVGPLVNLWGFGVVKTEIDTLPSEQQVVGLMENIGYEKLILADDLQAVLRTHSISLDLSAVAKGYGVDVLSELLESHGVNNYLVEIGGEIRTKGFNSRGEKWRIAIESPDKMQRGSVQRAIEIGDTGMATSGDYRNYFEINGVRYSHTIDPRTGHPVDHNLASVTVMSDSTAMADALATAFLVLGPEKSLQLANQHDIAAYFLLKSENSFEEISSNAFTPFMSN